MSFWDDLLKLGRPIVGLSPMDGVTDASMRYMSGKYGTPDIVFTEFVSTDALAHAKESKSVDRVMRAFIRTQDVGKLEKKPFEIAQVFGHNPELFYQAAVMIAQLGFDGMDINMGCPAHKVEEQGSGAGLIRTPDTAREIIREAKRGMQDYFDGKTRVDDLPVSDEVKRWVGSHTRYVIREKPLPVSLKTRLGVDSIVVEDWMKTLMKEHPAMITLHGRTLRQLYQGSADWEAIGRAAEVVHSLGGHILGNGDIQSLADLTAKAVQYKVDGGLIGRAAEGNPAIFAGVNEPDRATIFSWITEHVKVFEQLYADREEEYRNWFVPVRKHLAWYAHGFPGAAELRIKLVISNSREEVEQILKDAI